MSSRAWRLWTFRKLKEIVTVLPPPLTVPQTRVMAGGALDGPPASRPYVIYRFLDEGVQIKDDSRPVAKDQIVQVWVYDDPGSYDRIDSIMDALESGMPGPVVQHADYTGCIAVNWNGRGPELFDDEMKAITRFALLSLIGRGSS